jgi:filamentous hemagglutinin
MLMVVSEAARSQGKTSNPSEGGSAISQIAGGSQTSTQVGAMSRYQGGRLITLRSHVLLVLGLATVVATSAHADATNIVADRNAAANNQAAILQSSSGKTQVNIQTPSKAGVSRNVFSKFDVGADGAILNNSRKNAQTQLAGWVEGNPYLARGEARVILNEVNSNDPSRLSGYTEIAGGRAELVIANPAGITCAGCGFINASRTTLTTGQALMDQGKLTGFDVTGGKVRIEGDGMDSMGSDYTQIIAKTAEINAGIYAKNLDVITGSNQVSYEADAKDTVITSKNAANNSNQTTGVALDVSALGAMYAGKIRLIGTDKGMGVTNAGSIIASSGGLQLDNNGNLINSGSLIANQGNVDITTRGHSADNSGTIASSRDTATLNSSTLNNSGVVSSRGILSLQQTGAIDNSGELSSGSFDVKAAALNNSGTLLQTGSGKLAIDTKNLSNRQGGIIGQDLYPSDSSTPPSVTPSKTPPTTANNGSSVGTDDNSQPSETPAPLPVITRDGNIHVGNLTNTGSIYSNGKINVAADSIANQDKASLAVSTLNIADNGSASNTDSRLQLDQIDWQLASFDNSKGQIITRGGIALDVNNDIDNTQGTLASSGDITLNAKGDINNSAGLIQSSTNLSTDSSNLNNRNGKLVSQGTMIINSSGDLTNSNGNISSAKDASINSKTINNDSGQITAQGSLTTNSDSVNNSGQLYGKTETQLTTADAINNSGLIGSGGNTFITTGSLTQTDSGSLVAGMNADGKLTKTRANLSVKASGDITSQGNHIATGDVHLTGGDINLAGSNTQGSRVKTTARTGLNTTKATITATDTLSLSSADGILDNTEGTLRGGVLEIDAKRLINTDGKLTQTGKQDLSLALLEGIDNTRGEIASNSDNLTINTNLLNNSSGKIIHAGQVTANTSNLSINADSVNNTAGEILSVGAQTWQIAKDIDNTAGVVQAKRFNIAAGDLNNTDGRLLAVATDTTQDSPSAQTQSRLNVSGTINNTISNTKTKDTKADTTETAKGVISSNTGSLDISARTLTNNQGQLSSLKDLTVNTNTLTNSGGLYSQGNLDVTNQGKLTNSGSIAAQGDTRIKTSSLTQSADGQLIAGLIPTGGLSKTDSNLTVSSTGDQVNAGTNIATGDIKIEGSALDLTGSRNQSSTLSLTANAGDIRLDKASTNVADMAKFDTKGTLSNNGGVLQAGQFDWQINALSNVAGTISQTGNQAFNLVTNGTINNQKGVIGGNATSLNINSNASLNNTEGTIVHNGEGAATISTRQLDNVKGAIVGRHALNIAAAGDLDNTEGAIQGDTLTVRAKKLTNNNGQLVSQGGNLNLTGESINNQGDNAYIQSGNNLTIRSEQLTNSDRATIMAKGVANIEATKLDNNTNAVIASDKDMILQVATLSNAAQIVAMKQNLTINATSIDNQIGGQISAAGDHAMTTSQGVNNQGVIAANHQLNVQANGVINNKEGVLSGGAISLNSNADINNEGGLIAQTSADQTLSINAKGTLNNQNTKTNTAQKAAKQTGILANGSATIAADSINNQSGTISTKQLTLDTQSKEIINNAKGLLQATQALTLTANNSAALNNQGGQIVGDTVKLTVGNANRGRIDNNVAGSLIQAGDNLDITTGTLNNQNSKQDGDDKTQGIIANDALSITANTINNQRGQLLANNKVTLTAASQVNNQAGNIQSNEIAITDANLANRMLAVNNDQGRIVANKDIDIVSKGMSNTSGEILANGRADINVIDDIRYGAKDVINAKEVALTTKGNFTNSGKLTGQEQLDITAANIDNQKGAELSSNGTTQLTANTNINNRGLINGVNTYLDAGNSVNNHSNGRIYGDHVAIATNTLNNTPDVFTKTQVDTCVAGPGCAVEYEVILPANESNARQEWIDANTIYNKKYYKVSSDPAPVIAARQRLDIGVETLNNNPNEARASIFNVDFNGQAKIISNGELHIGGSLDDNHQATGRATTVNNKGASIESVGDMSISTETLNNVNADFQKITEKGIGKEVTKWRFKKDKQNRLFDPEVLRKNSWDYYVKETDEKLGEDYNDYNYTETSYKDVVVASDAARIISGGDIYLTGNDFLSDKSIILAGENQKIYGKELINDNVDGLAGRAFEIKDGQYQLKEVHSHALGSKKSLDDIGDPVPYTDIAINENYQLPILNQDIDKTIIAYKDDDVADIRELDGIKSAIQTLTNGKLTANDASSATTVATSGLADAAKLLEGFTKAGDSTLTDAQKQQLQALLDAQKQGSKVDQAAIDDLINRITDQIAQTASEEIRSSDTTAKLPNSSLYGTNPDSSADYLIETDPAFANYKDWLSSDYMLDRLQLDPNVTQKRLGDGYYEQQYIRDQIMMLTGRYYLGDYGNQDTQYKGLMDAGITTAQTLNLRPGIALTADQVAKLTTDIVWLVQQSVTLDDGSTQTVLVPKVYTRQAVGQIDGTGNLIAANELDIQLTGDLNNQGNIVGHQNVKISAINLTNANGGLIEGDFVQIGTKNDLNNLGSSIGADSAMQLDVGGDFNNQSLTYTTSSAKGASNSTRTGISQIASIYVGDGLKGQVNDKGNALTTFIGNVGGDTTFAAGRFDNQGGSSYLDTKGDVKLDAVNVGYQSNSIGDANNYFKQGESVDVGSQLSGTNDLIIKAGKNITGVATQVNSDNGTVGILADGNVDFKEGRNKQNLSTATKTISKDFFSKETTQDRYDMQSDSAIRSNIEGDKVLVKAGQDINFRATNAISDRGTQLSAGGDVNILAAENTSSETKFSQTKKSGLFGTSGGLGFTIGKQQTDDSNTKTALTHTASNIGAIDGNVLIDAGGTYQQTGSNLVAGMGADSNKDITDPDRGNTVVRAKQINIDNVMDVYTNQSEQKFKQSGLTVAVTNSLVDNAKSINNLIDAGGNTGSTRMKGMAAVAGVLKTKALAKEANSAGYDLLDGNLKGVGSTRIQATIGSSKSQSNSSSYTEVNQGSSINTNNLALIATGAGKDSNINVNGSDLTASNDALFQADNNLNVNGVAQNSQTRSNNKSSSTALGVYADTSGSGGITASASKAKGHANSDSTTYANSHINVSGTTTFDIGNDVNIKNGVLNTDKIQGVIGGDMTIESLQDTATYDSKQKNMGFSADIDIAGGGAGSSLSVNGGKTNLNSDYKAVGEQSGIFADQADLITQGKGTFKGGVFVTSKEAQDNGNSNIVFKQGVTATDLKNTTSYDGDAIQAGISIGSTNNKPQASMNGIGYGTDSDSDSSITKGGVSGYNDKEGIFTTDNREALAGQLGDVFDANQVNEELGAQTQITQAFDQERRKVKTAINEKEKKLRDEAEEARDVGDYETAVEKARAAEKLQNQGLLFDAVSGAIYGPNTNGVTGYVAKAASPFVASQVGTYFKVNEVVNSIDGGDRSEQGSAAHILAQGVLGAAISYATGNDAVTGGVSAGAGEATAPVLAKFLYGSSDPTNLTAEQKDTISAITSAVGLTIGATTGNANDAANAAETSKVAVEDNYYYADLKNINKASKKQVERIYNIQKSSFEGKCRSAGGDCNDVIQKMINFVENPYVKSNYGDLRNQTIAKLESNPELLITYFDSLAYKFNAKDRSILNRYIKPTLEAGGGAIGGVGSIGGAAYACGASAGIGCYAAVVAGSAGLSSSSDHLITGTKNFGKPLSQQDPTQIVQTLQGLGLSKEAAQTLQLGIDILGTGGVGFGVGTVAKSGKYVPTAQVIPNNFNLYAGRTLIYHDNIGGHAVAKHVGKSDQQLIARLSAEPRLGATSTFSDLYTAERAIGDTLRLNQTKVNEWLKLSSGPDRLVLPQSLGYNVGRVISRGATKSTNSQKVRLIIDKDPKAPKGFVIITSYPSQ